MFLIRKRNIQNAVFATIIESHGNYDPVTEKAENLYNNFKSIKVLVNDENYTAIEIIDNKNKSKILILANNESSAYKNHSIKINN